MAYFREITEHYRIEKRLSAVPSAAEAGGVFRAIDPVTGSPVALKLLPLAGALPESAQGFVRAMGLFQSLRHPSLPTLYDFGFTPDGHAFLVLEYVDGRGAEALQGGSPAQVLPLLSQVLDGLEKLAQAELAHHNLCPENLLVVPGPAPGRLLMAGLGTAALRPSGARPEGPATGFAAPELGRSPAPPADGRADLFSLALVACRLLEARLEGGGAGGRDPRSPRVALPLGVSFELEDDRALQEILERCLRYPPAERPAFAEVREAFNRALDGSSGPRPLPESKIYLSADPEGDSWLGAADPGNPVDAGYTGLPEPRRDPGDDTHPVFPPVGGAGAPIRTETLVLQFPTEAAAPPESPMEPMAAEELPAAEPGLYAIPPAPLAAAPEPSPEDPEAAHLATILPMPAVPSPAVAAADRLPRGGRFPGWIAAAAAVALLGAGFLWWRSREAAAPVVPPPVAAARPAARVPAPVPPSSPPAAGVALAAPLPEKLAAARDAFAEGKDEAARQALAAITRQEETAFSPEACTVYRVLDASLDAAAGSRRTTDFRAALKAGDLPQLAAAVRALTAAERAARNAEPGGKKELAAARQAADLYQRYDRAAKAGEPVAFLTTAGAVTAAFPRFREAADRREKTAAALEGEAETLYQTGAVDAALERLETLRRGWPDRPGLAEKITRYSAEQRSDQGLAGLLASVAATEARKRPDEGLALLASAKPTPRYEARLREARQRLEGELVQLDRNPPAIQLAAKPAALEYEKGAAIHIPLKITDDFQVKTVTVHVRPEGGTWTELPCDRSGADCTVEVPATLHQNRTVELYVVATDLSGHKGQLGTAEKPQQIRRKHWYDRLRSKGQE